jgi:hypothetical protein
VIRSEFHLAVHQKTKFPKRLFVKHDKVKRGFSFDIMCWYTLCQENSIEIYEVDQLTQERLVKGLIYAGAMSYCYWKRKEVDFTMKDVDVWVEEMRQKDLEEVWSRIVTSKVFRIGVKATEDVKIKHKKKVGKKLSDTLLETSDLQKNNSLD